MASLQMPKIYFLAAIIAMNAGIAAFRAKQPPAIIQVFDVGTGVMMGGSDPRKDGLAIGW